MATYKGTQKEKELVRKVVERAKTLLEAYEDGKLDDVLTDAQYIAVYYTEWANGK